MTAYLIYGNKYKDIVKEDKVTEKVTRYNTYTGVPYQEEINRYIEYQIGNKKNTNLYDLCRDCNLREIGDYIGVVIHEVYEDDVRYLFLDDIREAEIEIKQICQELGLTIEPELFIYHEYKECY